MKMRHALMIALVLVAVAGIAHAVSSDPSRTNPEGPRTLVGMPDGLAAPPPVTPATPADSPACGAVSSDGAQPVVPCQNFAYQCTQIGGPCGPLNQCHCNWFPDFGWACGR